MRGLSIRRHTHLVAEELPRNEIMYGEGGYAYVYLSYGIHHLFNVVTNSRDIPHAILIRALDPVEGIEEMLLRTRQEKIGSHTHPWPRAMYQKHWGYLQSIQDFHCSGDRIFIADDGGRYSKKEIAASPRIGVDYAGKDALLPYRFYVKGNPYVSGKPR
jgi:DNA-3-methyladenine glycosylase